MPNYDYECKKCGIFEVFQSMTAKQLTTCPTCKGKVRRLIGSGAGVIFKGPGFYCNDYKKTSAPVNDQPCPKAKEGCHGCKHG